MNREILFRGKRLVEGEPVNMIEGSLFTHPDGHFTIGNFWEAEPVDSDTVGQYIGLKDKNGRKIFEGDILSAHLDDEFPENETHAVVEWLGYGWALTQYDEGQGYHDAVVQEDDGAWEIIGNIHDNPELVEKNENK